MERKPGYHTITYRFRLYCDHREWLEYTKEIYNQVLEFYYQVLEKEPELAKQTSRQKLLRQLELLTIGARGQKKESIEYPFPYGKVPLYFRRAAVSDAIRLYRSRTARLEDTAKPGGHRAAPIFYKGMYKEFTSTSVLLKLWNGEKWIWESCGLDSCGRKWPDIGAMMSPVLKLEGKRAMLHVPIREEIADVRPVRERLPETEAICAAAFPGNDCMAVLVILGKDGGLRESHFIRGGSQFAHEKKKLLNRIRKNQESMGGRKRQVSEKENSYLKRKIRNLSEHYAHQVSRQIVEFCEEQKVTILVVPGYRQPINLNEMGYLLATSYDWIGRRIIQYLRYKAFGKGIIVTSVSTKNIAKNCHICGEPVKRFNKENKPACNYYGGKNYICPNGHKGNAYFNTAMNVGLRFLQEIET